MKVNYIIDSQEKKQFLALADDTQRESFIRAFWRIRDPDPNSESNTYKDEHYRRLAYADDGWRGRGALFRRWRTDQGRIYIVLGPPKQVMTYPLARNVRPLEIWFYEAANRALPPSLHFVLQAQPGRAVHHLLA